MARKPPDWQQPSLFPSDGPPRQPTDQPLELYGDDYAVQNDGPRAIAGTSADARPAQAGEEAAGDDGSLRQGAESQPPGLDRDAGPDAAGQRSSSALFGSAGDRPQ